MQKGPASPSGETGPPEQTCHSDQPEFPGCFYYHGSNSAEDLY